MAMKLQILRDLYYLDDEEETERRQRLERPSKDDCLDFYTALKIV
jgi:hypothetical protein